MLEVVLIRLTPPKLHIRNLEITPEMTRRVPLRLDIMLRPPLTIRQPLPRIILHLILRMRSQKLQRLRPQSRQALRRIVQVHGEAVRLVVVLHVAEDVVIDVAEEVDFGLDAPVVADVRQRGVPVEHARVPAAHLVVGDEVAVLDLLLLEHGGGFGEEVVVDPGGDGPVFFGD